MRALIGLILLSACGQAPYQPERGGTATSRALDQAAIASGQLPDLDRLTAEGTYGAATNIGEDRLCVARLGEALIAGLVVSYGTGGACVGRGTAERAGERLSLTLAPACRLDARLDGDGVTLPAVPPPGCQALCRGRASLAGVAIPKLSDDRASALALTDLANRPLCPG